jgi:hypothetical protein
VVFQRRFLRLQFLACQRRLRWSANPVTSNVPLEILVLPMPSLSFNAAVQRISLLLDMTQVNDVIAWADQEIEASTIPPNALIDVSMGRGMTGAAMAGRLSELIADPNDTKPLHTVLKIVADQIRSNDLDVRTAILGIHHYLRAENLLYDDPYAIFHNLETDLALIRDGIFAETKMDDVRNDLLESLDEIAGEEIDAE